MRPFIIPLLLACATPASAGDLWLTVEQDSGSESIRLHLPGNWLADSDEPVEVDVEGRTLDLAAEARSLRGRRIGAERRWTLDSDGKESLLTLSHAARTGPPADQLSVVTRGPKGGGMTMTMALEPDQLQQPTNHLEGVLDVDGVQVDLSEALCEQLKVSGPVVLVETTGPKGGGIEIGTR